MSDDQRQLALPVDLGTWKPTKPPEVAAIEIVEPIVVDAKIEIVEQPTSVVEQPVETEGDHAVNCAWQDGTSDCDCNYEGERPIEQTKPTDEYETVTTSMDIMITTTDDESRARLIEMGAEPVTPEATRTHWPSGSGASFSEDRIYRFELWRDTGIEYGPRGGPVAVIIGVNPSDADEEDNDPTITKDVGFAKRWGCAHVLKVNANAFVATDPDDMRKAFAQGIDIVGPDNDGVIRRACGVALLTKGKLVLAWGKNITAARQKEIYDTIIRFCGVTPMCLGINKDGTPKHTGRIAYDTPLVPWSPPT